MQLGIERAALLIETGIGEHRQRGRYEFAGFGRVERYKASVQARRVTPLSKQHAQCIAAPVLAGIDACNKDRNGLCQFIARRGEGYALHRIEAQRTGDKLEGIEIAPLAGRSAAAKMKSHIGVEVIGWLLN